MPKAIPINSKVNDLTSTLAASVKVAKSGRGFKQTIAYLTQTLTCEIDKDGEFVLPKSLAECADLLYRAREERLALDRSSERIAELEGRLKNHFIDTVPKGQTGVSGVVAHIQVESKPVPQVQDWDKFYKYVKRTGAFDMLQRRLNDGAVQERWENKKQVPGVGVFNAKKVSCTKI
jgi:hypothetical protein